MKAIAPNSAGYCLWVSLIVLGMATSVVAGDVFPLDVWEEMTHWHSKSAIKKEIRAESSAQPVPVTKVELAPIHLTFPFDVAKALNQSSRLDGKPADRHSQRVTASSKHHGNPYWLPEEFYKTGAVCFSSDVKRDR